MRVTNLNHSVATTKVEGREIALADPHLKTPRYSVWMMWSVKRNELKGRFHTAASAVKQAERLTEENPKHSTYIYVLHWPKNADRPVMKWDSFDGHNPSDKRAALRKFSQPTR